MNPAPWLGGDAVTTAGRILRSHHRAYGQPLLAGAGAGRTEQQAAQELFAAATVVLAHDGEVDPRLIYANRAALCLWRRPWAAMVGLPSRLTAEPCQRASRSAALARALQADALRGYAGIRIDSTGRRFRIEGARLWTLRDSNGLPWGQAAAFNRWWWLPSPDRFGSHSFDGEEAEPGTEHRTIVIGSPPHCGGRKPAH